MDLPIKYQQKLFMVKGEKMERKLSILIFLVLLIVANTYGQKPDVVNFEKVYSFLNSTITSDSTEFFLNESTGFGTFGDAIDLIFSDSLFDEADMKYFRDQLTIAGKVKWQDGKIIGAKVISEDEMTKIFSRNNGWKKFNRKFGDCLKTFALPIFNKNYEYCAFFQWTQCNYLTGGGSLDLYKLEKEKWVYISSYMVGSS
jgi:hypothetical protein